MDHKNRSLKNEWKAQQRSAVRKRFPLSDPQLQALFESVDDAVDRDGCDHSLRATASWLHLNQVDPAPVIDWLRDTGGYCDSEVIANSMDEWKQNRDQGKSTASPDHRELSRRRE